MTAPAGVTNNHVVPTISNHAILHQVVCLPAKNFHRFDANRNKPEKLENTENGNMAMFSDAIMKRISGGRKQPVCHHFMRLLSSGQWVNFFSINKKCENRMRGRRHHNISEVVSGGGRTTGVVVLMVANLGL